MSAARRQIVVVSGFLLGEEEEGRWRTMCPLMSPLPCLNYHWGLPLCSGNLTTCQIFMQFSGFAPPESVRLVIIIPSEYWATSTDLRPLAVRRLARAVPTSSSVINIALGRKKLLFLHKIKSSFFITEEVLIRIHSFDLFVVRDKILILTVIFQWKSDRISLNWPILLCSL